MGFDAEGYRKAAKAAGISDEEIEKDIAEEMGNVKPIVAPPQKEDVQIGGAYDWMIPAAVGAGLGAAATGIGLTGKKIKERWMSKPETPRIEPSFESTVIEAPVSEAPPKPIYSEAERKLVEQSEANRIAKQTEATVKQLQSKEGIVPASVAPIEPAQPTISQAVATGQSPTQAIEAEVAKQIEATPEKSKGGRPTKEVSEAKKAIIAANVPPGMKPDYSKPKGGIGPGPYHWFENQVGIERAPALWRELFGDKNVPLKDVQETYKRFAESVPESYTPRSQGALMPRGGTFGKSAYVPQSVKGGASPSALAGLGLGGLMIAPSIAEAGQAAKRGDVGMAASHAAEVLNVHPVTAFLNQLFGTSPQELETLRKADYSRKVGGGRGIAPPEAYQR